ncbi:YbaK/EbsC family protein [candidate division WOR-3 bacterium]|nr:YbaK/EbsC family protein [candidate division WOR-3 bacterium]MCK4528661.1 YbaK/EbsC family protein [candidate division WOR-3 bacterium]
MAISQKLKDLLDEHGVEYEVEKHRELFTAQEVAASEHITGYEFAKVVILKADGKFIMAVVPAPYDVSIDKIKALGYKKVEIASEEDFKDLFSECDTGAMPPFGNLYDIPFYVDEFFKKEEEIVFNSGTHTETVKIKREDYERLVGGDVYSDISMPSRK